MQSKSVLVLASILIVGGAIWYVLGTGPGESEVVITTFDECVRAGYPVMESYPRQCRTPEGSVFVENITNPAPGNPVATGGCFVGGCSRQICSDDPDVVSTCEYKEEYACYKSARCERQMDGKCGWTETPEFNICMNAILNPNADLK